MAAGRAALGLAGRICSGPCHKYSTNLARSRRYFPSHPRRGCAYVSPTGEMMRNFFAFLLRQLRAMEESPLSRERVNSKRRDYIEARLRLGAAAGLRLRSCCSVRATCCGECCRRPPSVDDSRCDAFTASGRCIRIWIQPRRFVLHWMAGVAQLVDAGSTQRLVR